MRYAQVKNSTTASFLAALVEDKRWIPATSHRQEVSVARMRLAVDLNRCQAYAQCCFLAPSVFELHGEEALWYEPEPDEAQRERVLRAAAACPVQAILVEERPEVPS
jgi:ferredoxin